MLGQDITSANERPLRIVTWNIRHGGARGEGVQRVIATLLGFQADVLVVTEFRCHARGNIIIAALREAGYDTSHPPTLPTSNTVMVASKTPTLHAASLTPHP
jgi:exodeoxyribonuclease-3